ncbi:hypothetical protein [Prosthecobacter sp.]|uniref:hypothetical protein n=1 Tax=Prosthecobacter sp. TaxID=1965333 RepID=UPI002ABABA36|nr:hypothetical protein [Prosthecobacter sp.]MDZ4402879.1 hypothetical protein [Prosthecobacter sp.]
MQAQRLGCDAHTAEDNVQDMFLRLLRTGRLQLLAELPPPHQQAHLHLRLRCHLVNRTRDARRPRRGGRLIHVPLHQADGAPFEIIDERADVPGSEPRLCELHLQSALRLLRSELTPPAWRRVSPWLDVEEAEAPLRKRQNGATRVALHRARRRLRELLNLQEQKPGS